jgi:hypothetical protein
VRIPISTTALVSCSLFSKNSLSVASLRSRQHQGPARQIKSSPLARDCSRTTRTLESNRGRFGIDMMEQQLNYRKWTHVAAVTRAARVLAPVFLRTWTECPIRLTQSIDHLINTGETAAKTGTTRGLSNDLEVETTELLGLLQLEVEGYATKRPELWKGNEDIRAALPSESTALILIQNMIDVACRCTRSAFENSDSGTKSEAEDGISWTFVTLEKLGLTSLASSLSGDLEELDRMLTRGRYSSQCTCRFKEGSWVVADSWWNKILGRFRST